MEAITREEKLLSGQQLEPITRKELFLAKAAGMDVKTPEPITREEMFLNKISGGGVSGGYAPVVEPLSVTENGTYNPPEGVDGYSPVTVSVAGSGGAFQVGTVVSADGKNLVVPCTLDNILIVGKYYPNATHTAYLLNATGLLAAGIELQVASGSSAYLTNLGAGKFSITKENGQTTFTQTASSKFTDEYCYIAWDNAE